MLPQEMNPIALRQCTLENKQFARIHTLAQIENNFLYIIFISLVLNKIGMHLTGKLGIMVEDPRHCDSPYWSALLPNAIVSAVVSITLNILLYTYPYFNTLNQLEKNLIDEKDIQKQKENIKNSNKKYYISFFMVLTIAVTQEITWRPSRFKAAYCNFVGTSNQECSNLYGMLGNFSKEIKLTLQDIDKNDPNSILPLKPVYFHNDVQRTIGALGSLPGSCSDLSYFKECIDKVQKFIDLENEIQKKIQNHSHPYIQKIADYFATALQQCILPGMKMSYYQGRFIVFNINDDGIILFLSFVLMSTMLFNLALFASLHILFPQIENHLNKNHFHYLTILLKGIEDISMSRFAPGYYRTEIKSKKLDTTMAYDELFFLLKKEGYNCDLQHEKIAIIKNLSLWGALFTKKTDTIMSTTFKNKFYHQYNSRVTLLKLFQTAAEQLDKLKTLIPSLRITSVFYRTSTSFGYKITLTYSEEFQNEIFKEDLKKILNIIFLKIENINQNLFINLEQATTIFSKEAFEKYTLAQRNLESKYGKKIDTIINVTKQSHRKQKIVWPLVGVSVNKEKICDSNFPIQITDVENNVVYHISKELTSPISGAIFTVFNTNQNLLCYFLLLPQVVNALQESEECQKFIGPVERGDALQWVGPEGERGFSYCKKKAEQLNLKQYTNDKPVDVQYKDPKYQLRIWGESRRTTENAPFYTMHTLAEKTGDQGKKYRILSR